jgi:hypothetical protein
LITIEAHLTAVYLASLKVELPIESTGLSSFATYVNEAPEVEYAIIGREQHPKLKQIPQTLRTAGKNQLQRIMEIILVVETETPATSDRLNGSEPAAESHVSNGLPRHPSGTIKIRRKAELDVLDLGDFQPVAPRCFGCRRRALSRLSTNAARRLTVQR